MLVFLLRHPNAISITPVLLNMKVLQTTVIILGVEVNSTLTPTSTTSRRQHPRRWVLWTASGVSVTPLTPGKYQAFMRQKHVPSWSTFSLLGRSVPPLGNFISLRRNKTVPRLSLRRRLQTRNLFSTAPAAQVWYGRPVHHIKNPQVGRPSPRSIPTAESHPSHSHIEGRLRKGQASYPSLPQDVYFHPTVPAVVRQTEEPFGATD